MSVRGGKAKAEDPSRWRTVAIRHARERVGDELHDVVVERESLGSQEEMIAAVRHVGVVSNRVVQARGRQQQATEMGMPVSQAVADEFEALGALREALVSLAGSCGAWVVQMDFEMVRAGHRFGGEE